MKTHLLTLVIVILVFFSCQNNGNKCCKSSVSPNMYQHGMVSWSELSTKDAAAASDFYQKVFKWQIKTDNSTGMMYRMAKLSTGGKDIAGIRKMKDEETAPAHWGVYITVEDITETIKMVETHGGKKLFGPEEIENVGTMAVIQDPQGAVVNIMMFPKEMASEVGTKK